MTVFTFKQPESESSNRILRPRIGALERQAGSRDSVVPHAGPAVADRRMFSVGRGTEKGPGSVWEGTGRHLRPKPLGLTGQSQGPNGAGRGIRTLTPSLTGDFESPVSTVPPPRRAKPSIIRQAAPTGKPAQIDWPAAARRSGWRLSTPETTCMMYSAMFLAWSPTRSSD